MTEQHTDGYKRKSGQILVRTLPGQTTSHWRLPAHCHFKVSGEIELTDCRAQHYLPAAEGKSGQVLVRTYLAETQATSGIHKDALPEGEAMGTVSAKSPGSQMYNLESGPCTHFFPRRTPAADF
jgi:hypothetical protein